LRQLRKV